MCVGVRLLPPGTPGQLPATPGLRYVPGLPATIHCDTGNTTAILSFAAATVVVSDVPFASLLELQRLCAHRRLPAKPGDR